jgi:transposase InsO family protein
LRKALYAVQKRHERATGPRELIYLATVLDWFTSSVLARRVSMTLEADFCIEAVKEALARHGAPEIFKCAYPILLSYQA